MKWLNWGDKNTKFFPASTIQRKSKNILERIQTQDDTWLEGQAQIMSGIWTFYSTLYASEPPSHVNECLNVVSTLVTQDMNLSLMKPISMMEIEKAAFPMGSMGSSLKRIGI